MAAGQLALTVLMGALLVGIATFLARTENWHTYAPLAGGDGAAATDHEHKPPGIVRWLTTVDHKDIGILYGTYGVIAFLWGGVAVGAVEDADVLVVDSGQPTDDTWRFVSVLRRGGAVAGRDRGVRAPVLHAGEEGGDTDEERPHESR